MSCHVRALFKKNFLRCALAGWLIGGSLPLQAEDKPADNQRGPIAIAKLKRKSAVDYNREIMPILAQNCLACHNKTRAKADLNLETPADMLKGGESGKAINPKHGADSLLVKVAAHQKKPVMPPRDNKVNAADLTPDELALIKLWIDQGAKGSAANGGPIEWQPLPEGLNPIFSTAVTADGEYAVCGRANQIFVYQIPTGKLVTRLTDPQLLKSGLYGKPGAAHRDMIYSLAFNARGDLLASGSYREVKLWRHTQNTRKFTLSAADKTAVRTVAASSDGKWFATAGEEGRIRIWETLKGKAGRTINASKGAITALAFSPDGTRLLSTGADKQVRAWDVNSGNLFAEVQAPSVINAVTWLMDGRQFATAGADNSIRIWWLTVEEGEGEIFALRELKGHTGAVNALTAAGTGNLQLLSGSSDGSVRQWNLENGQMIRQLNHGAPVWAVAIRPDGKRIASAGSNNVTKLWETDKGQMVAELKGDKHLQDTAVEREQHVALVVADLAYWKTAHQAATNEHNVQLERVKKATEADTAAQKVMKEKQEAFDKAKTAKAMAEQALTDLNALLKKANDDFAAADKASKEAEALAKMTREQKAPNKEQIDKATATAAEKAKLAATAKSVADKLANDNKDKLKQATDGVANAAKAVENTEKDFKKAEMARSNTENELQLGQKAAQKAADEVTAAAAAITAAEARQKQAESDLQAAKKAAVESEQPVRALAFSPDNGVLVTAGNDHLLHTWSAENGAALAAITGHTGVVTAIAFSGTNTLISCAGEREAVVWDLEDRWKLEQTIGTGEGNSPLADRVNAIRFSPDGKQLATGGGEPTRGGEIKIWSLADGKLVRDLPGVHSDTVLGLDYSADGKYLASASADRFVRVTDLTTGKVVKAFEGHTHYVTGVSWKRDGRTLASSGADNAVKIWDFVKGDKKKNVEGFGKEVTSIHFIGVTDQALATSADNQVRAFNEKGENVRAYGGSGDSVYASDATPDGRFIVAGGQDSVLRIWNGTNGQAISSFAPPAVPAATVKK